MLPWLSTLKPSASRSVFKADICCSSQQASANRTWVADVYSSKDTLVLGEDAACGWPHLQMQAQLSTTRQVVPEPAVRKPQRSKSRETCMRAGLLLSCLHVPRSSRTAA